MKDDFRLSAADAAVFARIEAGFDQPPHPEIIMPDAELSTSGETVDVAYANALLAGRVQDEVAEDIASGSALALAAALPKEKAEPVDAEQRKGPRFMEKLRDHKRKIAGALLGAMVLGGLGAGLLRSGADEEMITPIEEAPAQVRLKAMQYSLVNPHVLRLTATCEKELAATADYIDEQAAAGVDLSGSFPNAREYRYGAERAEVWHVPCNRVVGKPEFLMKVDGMLVLISSASLLAPGVDTPRPQRVK